ncbi:MAG: hypothetical protein KIS94_05240 [Chitinophagales bacterium]|nr:hypothetical protein [Chitinophagales bacterium]
MRTICFSITALSVLLFGLSACKKDCTTDAPVIAVTSPLEGSSVQLPDSVHLAGTISDDVWLKSAAVIITNHNGDTVFNTQPDVYGKKTHDFTYNYFTSASGTFHLQVSAEDNEGQKAMKEAMFTVLP